MVFKDPGLMFRTRTADSRRSEVQLANIMAKLAIVNEANSFFGKGQMSESMMRPTL
jgi:hypothetical protein